jgi:hypothetical protein
MLAGDLYMADDPAARADRAGGDRRALNTFENAASTATPTAAAESHPVPTNRR